MDEVKFEKEDDKKKVDTMIKRVMQMFMEVRQRACSDRWQLISKTCVGYDMLHMAQGPRARSKPKGTCGPSPCRNAPPGSGDHSLGSQRLNDT